jgi:hypothetical protein
VLRAVSRDRAEVTVGLVDGSQVTGTVDRVGADHVDVTISAGDSWRRPSGTVVVRTASIALLRAIW